MKYLSPLLLIINLSVLSGQAQIATINIAAISEQLTEIRTVKETVKQTIIIHAGTIVNLQRTTTDVKEKKKAVTYRFSLADIDPMKLQQVLERDMMKVLVPMVHNRRLITELKEVEISRYVPRLKVDVEDSEQASNLIEALKNASEVAKELENGKYMQTSLEEVLLELNGSVKAVEPKITQQSISFSSDKKEKLNLTVKKDKGAEMRYEFYLKDLNRTAVNLEAHGTDLTVVLPTNGKEKLIKVFENGLAKTFTNKAVIHASDVENGKHILRLLEMAIGVVNGAELTVSSSGSNASKFSFTEAMNTGKQIEKPSFSNQPYWCTASNGSLNEFEKSALNVQTRVTISGGQGLYYLNGTKSTKRFNGKSKVLAFIWTKGGEDPSNIVSMYRFKVNDRKGRREYVSTKANWFGGTESEDRTDAITFKSIGNGVFIIQIDNALPSGEYFFATEKFMYAFGID